MVTFKKEWDVIKKLYVIRIKFSLSKKATKIKKISQLIWSEQHCFENKDQCISKCFGPNSELCICKEHAAQGWVCISRLYNLKALLYRNYYSPVYWYYNMNKMRPLCLINWGQPFFSIPIFPKVVYCVYL